MWELQRTTFYQFIQNRQYGSHTHTLYYIHAYSYSFTHTHTLPRTYPIFTQIHTLTGANQAIQDGYCLALQLSAIGSQHSSLQAALSKYEGIRKFPTAKITFNSWFLGFIETQRGIGAAVRDRFFNTMYRLGVAQVRLRRSLLLLLWVSLAVILTYCDALCIPQFVFLDGATSLHPKSQTLNLSLSFWMELHPRSANDTLKERQRDRQRERERRREHLQGWCWKAPGRQ